MRSMIMTCLLVALCALSAGCRSNCEAIFGNCAEGGCGATWLCGNNSDVMSVRVDSDGSCACLRNGEPIPETCDASMCDVIRATSDAIRDEGSGEVDRLDDEVWDVCGFAVNTVEPFVITSSCASIDAAAP